MKFTILTTLIIMLSIFGFSQEESKYSKFKTGTFEYVGEHEDTKVIRSKRKQVEISNEGKSKLILKIDWVNDSTYNLIHKKSINSPGCLKKGYEIHTKIIKVSGNKYYCSYTCKPCGSGECAFRKIED